MFSIGSTYVKSDPLSAIIYPMILVAVLTAIGEVAVLSGLLKGWYATQYAVISMICASRICVRSGIWCAVLSMAVHSYVFLPAKWALDWPSAEQAITYASMIVGALLVGRRSTTRLEPETDTLPTSSTLPFVRPDGVNGVGKHHDRFWSVPEPSGVWRDDCQLGSQYARIYVESWHRTGTGPLLTWIVRDMVKQGRYSGIETGFISTVARAALSRAPHNDRAALLIAGSRPSTIDDADDAQSQGSVI